MTTPTGGGPVRTPRPDFRPPTPARRPGPAPAPAPAAARSSRRWPVLLGVLAFLGAAVLCVAVALLLVAPALVDLLPDGGRTDGQQKAPPTAKVLTDRHSRVQITVPDELLDITSPDAGELTQDPDPAMPSDWDSYVPDIEAGSYDTYVSVLIDTPVRDDEDWIGYHEELADTCGEDCELVDDGAFLALDHHRGRQTQLAGADLHGEFVSMLTTVSTERALVQVWASGPPGSEELLREVSESVLVR